MEGSLPPKIRTFVAIFPPSNTAERLEAIQVAAKKVLSAGSVSWTSPEQIHLTLNFLGNIESERLIAFETALAKVSGEIKQFSLNCAALGAFPTVRSPRILWAGLTGELDPLQQLKKQLDAAMAELGIVPEERAFHPHLTVGRVKDLGAGDRKYVAELIQKSANETFGSWRVEQFDLMRSMLSPHGAHYSVLRSFPLGR